MPCDYWTFLRFSQLLDDSFYLTGRKRLAGGFVARRLQLLPELGAAANPTHQVACQSWVQRRIQLIRWLTAVRGLLSGKYIKASSFLVYARIINISIAVANFSLFTIHFYFNIELAIVFAVWWELVVHQRGQHLPQLQEEALAGCVAVGVHVEGQTQGR